MSKTVTLYECDKCRTIIQKPEDGVVVHGNIYVADPEERGGLVGNNFPTVPPASGIYPSCEEQVEESVFCKSCFLSIVFPKLKITSTRGFFDEPFVRQREPLDVPDPHNINGDR